MKSIFKDELFNKNQFTRAEELRSEASLVRTKVPLLGQVWLTTSQKATGIILKDEKNFTLRKENGKVVGLQWWMPKSLQFLANNMLTMDGADHTRLRYLVDHAFRRDVILKLTPQLDAIANRLAANLFEDAGQGGAGKLKEVDLIEGYARPLAMAVICELLGLDHVERDLFSKWALRITNVENVFDFLRMFYPLRKMRKYLGKEIERQRIDPNDGLIAELVKMQTEGAQISDEEMIAMVFLLLMAGHETTTHVISGGVFELIKHPDQLTKMLSSKEALSIGCEELLRYVSAVQFTKPRNVQNDIVVEGVELKEGDVVFPFIVGANSDPVANECPHSFDVSRKPNKHIAFGAGAHFCLGHQLARVEIASAVKALFTYYPDLELAVDKEDVKWSKVAGIRRMQNLPVRLKS